MGGSLTGLADDATAALTNPSACRCCRRRRCRASCAAFHFSTAFTQRGNARSRATGRQRHHQGLVAGRDRRLHGGRCRFFSFVCRKEPGAWRSTGTSCLELEDRRSRPMAPFVSSVLNPDPRRGHRFLPVSAHDGPRGREPRACRRRCSLGKVASSAAACRSRSSIWNRLQQRFCPRPDAAAHPGAAAGGVRHAAQDRREHALRGRQDAQRIGAGVERRASRSAPPRASASAPATVRGRSSTGIDNRRRAGAAAAAERRAFEGTGIFKVPDILSFGAVAKPNWSLRQGDVLRSGRRGAPGHLLASHRRLRPLGDDRREPCQLPASTTAGDPARRRVSLRRRDDGGAARRRVARSRPPHRVSRQRPGWSSSGRATTSGTTPAAAASPSAVTRRSMSASTTRPGS